MGLNPKDFKTFKLSKPFGYYPADVDKAVKEYEQALNDSLNEVQEKNAQILSLKQEISSLENELKDLHLQFASMEMPDMSDNVQSAIFKSFKKDENGELEEKVIKTQKPFKKPNRIENQPIKKNKDEPKIKDRSKSSIVTDDSIIDLNDENSYVDDSGIIQ